MNYKVLGTSALRISEVSFGCMSLSRDDAQNASLLHRAMDQGINLFDTADLYEQGENEKSVGRAFKGIRKQVIIATKVGNQWRKDGSGWDWNPSKAYILQSVEASLQRLQTDYIDLYQLHGGTMDDPIDETIEAFELLKQQGKIRYYGISSIRPSVIREYVKRSNMVSVMMQYSLLDRRPEESCLNLLHKQQIGVLARGSLAKGLLVNKPAAAYLNYSEDEIIRAAKAVQSLATPRRSAAQIAIRFALHHPAIASAVIGIRTVEQMEDAIQAGKTFPLDDDEVEKLTDSLKANTYAEHR